MTWSNETKNYGVNVLTKDLIDNDILKTLGLGLKFIPTPLSKFNDLISDSNKYIRNLKLHYFFRNNKIIK